MNSPKKQEEIIYKPVITPVIRRIISHEGKKEHYHFISLGVLDGDRYRASNRQSRGYVVGMTMVDDGVENVANLIIPFHDGPVARENGVDGLNEQTLLAIIIDRLQGHCKNQQERIALSKCLEALRILRER